MSCRAPVEYGVALLSLKGQAPIQRICRRCLFASLVLISPLLRPRSRMVEFLHEKIRLADT